MNDTSYRRTVGQRIGTARRAAGLTHAQLAARLGWPRDTLIHYEHGRRALSIERLAAIADALGMHPAVFLVDDTGLGTLIQRLAQDSNLRAQVTFFLTTLDDE